MPINIYSSVSEYIAVIEQESNLIYSIIGGSRVDPEILLAMDGIAEKRSHQAIVTIKEVRGRALERIKQLFNVAQADDQEFRYSYSAKMPVAIPEYQDIAQILLILVLGENDPDKKVVVLVKNARLAKLLKLCINGERTFYSKYNYIGLRAIYRILRTLARCVCNRKVELVKEGPLFFSLSASCSKGRLDTYFDDFPNIIEKKRGGALVYFAAGHAVKLPSSKTRIPIEAFTGVIDVIASLGKSLLALRRNSTKIPVGMPLYYNVIIDYLKWREVNSGDYFYNGYLLKAFEKMMQTVMPIRLIYLFENRNWEKHLLSEARKRNVSKCIGYQHTSITPRHFAYQIEQDELQSCHFPDAVITNGNVTARMLRKDMPMLADKLYAGASLRRVKAEIAEPGVDAVLVPISTSKDEAFKLISIVYEASNIINIPFIIRPHPVTPVNDLFDLYAWQGNVELSEGKSLSEDLDRSSVIAYSSSTVALEGMLYGRLPIFIDIGDVPSGDPIAGEYLFKRQVNGGKALAAELAKHLAMDKRELFLLREHARNLAEDYLVFPSKDKLEQMEALMFEL